MRRLIKNILFGVGSSLRNSDLFFALAQYRPSLVHKVVNTDTGFCIEGFQRSGNTYMELMFELSNPKVRMSHHIHGVANIKKAIRLHVPVVVLIRAPEETLASLITYDDHLSPGTAINAYLNYYNKVWSIRSNCLIIEFKSLVEDFNAQITRVNIHYGTQFAPCNLEQHQISNIMDQRQRKYLNKNSTPYPSKYKKKLNLVNRDKILNHPHYSEALTLYRQIESIIS